MIHVIYRICDQRDGRTKIPQITKRQCFLNAVAVFGTTGLSVVADNTCPDTLSFLGKYTSRVHATQLGNSGSFLFALELAAGLPGAAAVYLLEDDYLHSANAADCILEGLERADYVSLYDHPDKYLDPSPNPLVRNGGENTKVILTASTHWKYTNSTTMTFAARAGTLKADHEIMRAACTAPIPRDYEMFRTLAARGRTLVTPIPGRATHCDQFPSPFIFSDPAPAFKMAADRTQTV